MKYEIPGEAEIECKQCTSSFFVSGADIYIESMGSWEKNMGPEAIFAGSSDFICPNCENNIEITYEASEYPKGVLNYADVSVTGGKLIAGFGDIDFSFEDKIYSYEEQLGLYLPAQKKIITNLNLCAYDLISKIYRDPKLLYRISPRDFEKLIAEIFSIHGFMVDLTQKTRDGGRDIIAIRSDLGIKSKSLVSGLDCQKTL